MIDNRSIILIVIGAYLPGTNAGGPVRTTSNMVEWLGDEFQFRIITANHDFNSDQCYPDKERGKWYPVGKAQVRYLQSDELSFESLRRIIRSIDCKLIYVDSVLATLSIKFLILHQLRQFADVPVIIVPRGNLEVGARSLKPLKKRLYFAIARRIGLYRKLFWHASNVQEKLDIKQIFGISDSKIEVISNLPSPSLKLIQPSPRTKIEGSVNIVFLSRVSRKKNLDYLLSLLEPLSGDITLDIYGTIEDIIYWGELQTQIHDLPRNIRVNYCGIANFDNVADILAKYHLFVLPTRGENFGHVILEALCAGCPVLISDNTPWRNLEQAGAGWDVPLENPAAFQAVIGTIRMLDQVAFDVLSQNARILGYAYLESSNEISLLKALFRRLLANYECGGPEKLTKP